MSALLETRGLTAFYGDFQALFGIDFEVEPGEAVAIIGANGAGKSTFLKTLTGLLRAASGRVRFDGAAIDALPPAEIVRRGIAMVPEGRRLFPSLSVEENLLIGAYARRPGPWNLRRVYQLFPALEPLREHPGNAISGGQQQMAAIGRALLANPRVLICDEISLGLAPMVVSAIYAAFPAMLDDGLTLVVVEQDVGLAQRGTHRLYCFQEGRVALRGLSRDLAREDISKAYFGVG
jgi:branched-chain amino acid transport system ATP-binding protein